MNPVQATCPATLICFRKGSWMTAEIAAVVFPVGTQPAGRPVRIGCGK
ncbi:hypothetical protein [Methanosarcina sp. MSH10X1]|nr:hypothetical protein [Methanosarcina sp. MSH10X1]